MEKPESCTSHAPTTLHSESLETKESIISFQLKVYTDENVINDTMMWIKATCELECQLLILKADLLVLLGYNI